MAERVSQDAAGSKHNDPPRGPPGVPGPPLIPRRLPGLPGGEPRNTSVPYSLVAHRAIRPEQTETDFARTRKMLRNRQRKDSPDAEQKERYQGTLGWSRRYPGRAPNERPPKRETLTQASGGERATTEGHRGVFPEARQFIESELKPASWGRQSYAQGGVEDYRPPP